MASLFKEVFDGVGSFSPFFVVVPLPADLDGGGDFNRGDVGHDGEFCPDFMCLSEERGPSAMPSTPEDCRTGLWTERARWTAAAEGTVGCEPPATLFRVGLNSWLPLRDRES